MEMRPRVLLALCASLLIATSGTAQNNAVIRVPKAEPSTGTAKSPVPTRDTLRPLTRQGELLVGQPETPGGNRVYYYFEQYDQAMKGLVKTSTAYHQKQNACRVRAFNPQEQVSAGCQQTDTVAECSKKLLAWCTAAERKPYRESLGELSAAARRLSKEAALEADTRAAYLRMP